TRFALNEDEPVQRIEPPQEFVLPVRDLSALPPADREAATRQIIDTAARQPFDLEAVPLLRVQLLRLAVEEHVLLLNVHHIVSDGWSMGGLGGGLTGAYNAFAEGRITGP